MSQKEGLKPLHDASDCMLDFGCMTPPNETGYFWRNLLRAVEVEPREAPWLRGSSGIDHRITAIGVDKARRRVVVISSVGDPRTAAFIQSDLQLAIPRSPRI
jgi:hypothetical protein